MSYNAQKDLVPLGVSSRTPTGLVVRSDAPYRSFAELIDYAKKNPGQVRVGHPGVGSVGEFCILLVNALTGVVLALGALGALIKAGTLRGLAISNRVAEYADIPTLKELGYRKELFGVWFSYLAPAGIPEYVRKALVGAIEQAVKAPAVAAKLAPLGTYATPEQQAAEIREEFRRVGEMVKKAGLTK